MSDRLSIWIGYDPEEVACFAVARTSAKRCLTQPVPVRGLVLDDLRRKHLYDRPTERVTRADLDGNRLSSQLWDVRSGAGMSTQFACSRFLTPFLARDGLALFTDCDVLFRRNPMELFALHDRKHAVSCVKHVYVPASDIKMGGKEQTNYSRKNWSSVMIFDCNHPSNARLTLDMVNTLPGRDLHRFCWLEDHEIGELPPRWNYLVGETKLAEDDEPALIHWTNGAPCIPGYENAEYASEFWSELTRWAA